jgi:short-subunit dehydrogenase
MNMIKAQIVAHVKMVHAILPRMIKKRDGIMINVSSSGAFLPSPKTATYRGTKAFLRAFTKSLDCELADTGVQVQMVCPGLIRTDRHSRLGIKDSHTKNRGLFQWIDPEDVVDGSLRCLEKKKVVCVPGWMTRWQGFMRHILPESHDYKTTGDFFHKYGWTQGA